MKLKRMYHPILRTEKTAGNEIGIFVVLLCLLCILMCDWNIVDFLFSPRGI